MKNKILFLNLCALSFLVGCTGVKVDDEDNQGTDDTAASDDDDSVELYGPDNDWYHAAVADVPSPDGCGFQQGDYACNFTMVDQNGDQVELYQFAGQYIVLDLFAEW